LLAADSSVGVTNTC